MPMLWLVIASVAAFGAVLCFALWLAHLRFWRWRLSTSLPYASNEVLPMPDGSFIELRRIGAPTHGRAHDAISPVPVLLIHGLAMNHRNNDLHEEYSFARYLHAQGRDVWLVTLRSGRRWLRPFSGPGSDFASIVKYDVPGAVAAVLARTRRPQLDLVGFSMGGMVLYASLGRSLEARLVRRVVVFGSPGKIRPLGALALGSLLPPALTPSAAWRSAFATIAFMPRVLPRSLRRRLYNPDNIDRRLERSMMCDVWETVPGRLAADFLRWSMNKGEISVEGQPILNGLARLDIPACFFAGSVDWLAPEDTVRAAFDAWGRDLPDVEKRFVVLGRAHGATLDYGHCDMAFGLHVRDEVFAPAARFLNVDAIEAQQRSVQVKSPRQPDAPLEGAPQL